MKDQILIHEISEPEGYGAFDNQDEIDYPRRLQLDNPCHVCGRSLDYEGDINNMCNCQ